MARTVRPGGATLPRLLATGDESDICYIKPSKDFIAFGFSEAVNPAHEARAHMHPVAWNATLLDAETEAKIRALLERAAA